MVFRSSVFFCVCVCVCLWVFVAPLLRSSLRGGGLVLTALFASELAKMCPGKPANFYDDLDGLEVSSLASQCGEWAQAGEVPTTSPDGRYAIGTVAGGCFWGTELVFQRIEGVLATAVGYTQV